MRRDVNNNDKLRKDDIKVLKRKAAEERNEARSQRSDADQLSFLDRNNWAAKRERANIAIRMEKNG